MKKILETILGFYARLALILHKPKIVAITGSVGKSSAKEAIALVLASKFAVRATKGNLNSQIGLPLAVLGFKDSGAFVKSISMVFEWIGILIVGFFKIFQTNFPEVLVLEIGADHPGDISYLMDLIGPAEVGVLTDIGISHLEFFPNPEILAKEKLSLIKKLPKSSAAILNFDNPKVYAGRDATQAAITGYGFSPQANILISDFQIIGSEGVWGANFKIHNKGNVVPFFLPGVLGKPSVYAAAAAAAVGLRFGINLVSASESLKNYSQPPGRLRLIEGIKNTKIIDDTYNSAPDSAFAALETLKNFARGRKMAVLGDMAELGSKTESGHRDVALKIMENNIDVVFLIGPKSKFTQDELAKRKFSGRVFWLETSDEARSAVAAALLPHDTVLVKGSQAMRMEKIVKEIIADPKNAENLLVRQSKKWM
jgi:UDP-N-acetylmuramyl pentapeptide synthase